MDGQVSSELKVVQEVEEGDVISVGSIKYSEKKLLGKGSYGTAVYQGRCGTRKNVAVKRIFYIDEKQERWIEKEIKHLQKLEEDGINVIRYYHVEKSKRFYFIAMELAAGTVEDYVERKQQTSEVDEMAILRDSSIALEWLHARTIIHRDIKPSNILLVKNKRGETVAKLADFGVSKDLTTSNWTMSGTFGTQGWMAPEVILDQKETPGAADVFSLGLVFFYLLSKGRHPFFKSAEDRKMNIRAAEAYLEPFQEGSAKTLIAEMIRLLPKDRPTSKYVANHPTFWNEEKRSNFIQVISDVIKDGNDEELRTAVNKDPTRVFGEEEGKPKDWRKIIDTSLDKGSFKSYKEPTTFELLRLVRNKLHHFNELSEEVRSKMGFSTPSGLVDYIAVKFPLLLVHVWEAARIRRDKPHLRKFYTAVDAIIRVGPNTIILPAGAGLIELTELLRSRETVERLSVSAADLPRLREQLPANIGLLNVRDCLDLTAGSLEPLTRFHKLQYLTLSVGVPDTVSLEPLTRWRWLERLSVTAAELPLLRGQLPKSLRLLNVRGPEVTEPRWPEWYENDGLSVSLQGVAADTISHLADLGRTAKRLNIYDCPALTAGSLEPLTRCHWLERLTLSGGVPDTVSLEPLTRCPGLLSLTLSGGVPDAVLDSLSGCPRRDRLTLGDRQRPAETAFTAAAYTRLVKSCRKLWVLYLHCTADTGRAVLTALKETDLRDSDGRPRTIHLYVPGELYDQLKRQEGGGVKVFKWY